MATISGIWCSGYSRRQRKLVRPLQFYSFISKMGEAPLSLHFFRCYNEVRGQILNSSVSLKPVIGKSHCVQQDPSSRQGSYVTWGGMHSYVHVSLMQRNQSWAVGVMPMSLKVVFLLSYGAVKSTDKCRMHLQDCNGVWTGVGRQSDSKL